MRYRVDPSWWRHSRIDGETVVAGSPPRVFRFSPTASNFLDVIESGSDLDSSTEGLQTRLVDAGAIHPIVDRQSVARSEKVPTLSDVTLLIPAHVHGITDVRHIVDHAPGVAAIIVIDDGSPTPLEPMSLSSRVGVQIIRHETARGPAAARNRALDLVDTDFVLFVDHDIELPIQAGGDDFWQPLLFHFLDSRTALVAPRVRSTPGSSALERHEERHSPLDMGPAPARVAPGARVSYVPSACVLVRMTDLRELGGFDEELRYGEDVDFAWRADSAGKTCRYEPAVVLSHAPRSTWRAMVMQRFHYGTAAASLEDRHPGSTRPVRTNRWSAVALVIAITGHPVIALGITASSIVRLAKRLGSIPDRNLLAFRLVILGNLSLVRAVLDSTTRTWWPITVLGGLVSRRIRTLAIVGVVVRSLAPIVGRRTMSKSTTKFNHDSNVEGTNAVLATCIQIVDDVAYGSGVWWGALKGKDVACLIPRLD